MKKYTSEDFFKLEDIYYQILIELKDGNNLEIIDKNFNKIYSSFPDHIHKNNFRIYANEYNKNDLEAYLVMKALI